MNRARSFAAATLAVLVLLGGWSLLITTTADAHRSGCHSQHSCPSDANPPTYRCGDTGRGCTSPNNPSSAGTPTLSGPPTASDCQNYPQYYDASVCSGAPQHTSAPTTGGGGSSASACGVERWSVKTGTDSGSGLVDLKHSTRTTVANLTSLARPSYLPPNGRVSPVETTQWTIDANLVEYKIEADSDVHLVLHDAASRSMIVEIPSPSCVSSTSPMKAAIAAARTAFDARFHPIESWRYTNTHVTITGPGFWDFFHGQTGVAANAIEIHPVLSFDGSGNPPPAGEVAAAATPNATASAGVMETAIPSESPSTTPTPLAAGATSASAPPSSAATAGGLVILLALLGGAGYGIYRLVRRRRGSRSGG